jgi:hypothetical protein
MDADLLVRPVVLRADSQVAAIFELAEDGFRPIPPTIGQDDLLDCPRLLNW